MNAPGDIPLHIAIIMDGNHRWASARKMPGAAGHRARAQRVREVAEHCAQAGVKNLTLFAFSTENWRRPPPEVRLLMDLMRRVMDHDIDELHRRGVRLRFIGERSRFQADMQERMTHCEVLTQSNDRLNLTVAVNFGGRWDIVEAARRLAHLVQAEEIKPHDIDEGNFARATSLSYLPDPDLLIRTGGDHRISNFLLWNLAYTELYFTDLFWPDFDEAAVDAAMKEYASRKRRFGGR